VTYIKVCEQDGAEFEATREHARFCSGRCRIAWFRAHPEGRGASESARKLWSEGGREQAVTEAMEHLWHLALMADHEQAAAIYDAMAAVRKAYDSSWQPLQHPEHNPQGGPLMKLGLSLRSELYDSAARTRDDVRANAATLIWSALRNAYEEAADQYRWERGEALDASAHEIAEAKAQHDDEVAHVEPAKGTRTLVQQIGQLTGELLKRDPESFARRVRRADLGEGRAEIEDLGFSELESWAEQAREVLDERD
jgi:hypothetical protein